MRLASGCGHRSLIVDWFLIGNHYVRRMQLDGDIAQVRANFGRRVSAIRSELGLSQYDFSDMTGVNRGYLIEVEKGRRNVSFDNIAKISHGLGVPLAHLFAGVDSIWYTVEYDDDFVGHALPDTTEEPE